MELFENPIQNEPGYENDYGYRCKDYNKFIEHENIRIAIIDNYKNKNREDRLLYGYKYTDSDTEYFRQIMKNHIEKNINEYLEKVVKISKYNNTLITNIYSCSHINKWESFNDFFKTFDGYIEKKPEKVLINKCPSIKSNQFDVGHIMVSEYNNKKYIVKLTKSGIKRWSLYKEIATH